MNPATVNTPPSASEIEVSLFGPGYGESILIHLGLGEWLIVDSCLNANRYPAAVEYLEKLGVDVATQVKLIVATHWHDDHIRGLGQIHHAAQSAKFVVSNAINATAFRELLQAVQANTFMDTTGLQEWSTVLKTLAERKRIRGTEYQHPLFAIADRKLFERKSSTLPCEVWSLSPSDQSIAKATSVFSEMLPKALDSKKRLIAQSPNHTSIVLWIKLGDEMILLGADLEQVANEPGTGWSVIVQSQTKPQGKARIFKVPHHGSKNGHNDDTWKHMLVDQPFAILTPYARGANPPPQASDIARMKALTPNAYITNKPGLSKDKRRYQGPIDRTIAETVKSIRDVPLSSGQIRLRSSSAGTWNVELLGTAISLASLS